jgi:hypothetical protein
MAIREGRCPNCGSILHLDGNTEKGHCLFCDAVFQNKTAFEIASDPKTYTFPNLPQPKYDGPSLEPSYMGPGALSDRRLKQPQQIAKKTPKAEPLAYVPKEPVKLPAVKMSRQAKIKSLIIGFGVIVLIAAVSVPLILYRNNTRSYLLDRMEQIAPFAVNKEQAVVIRRLGNTYLLIAADSAVSEDDMILLFKNFCEQRAAVLKLDVSNFNRVYKPVTVKLVTPEGGYLIERPKNKPDLDSGAATKPLP